jgi:hypothetical protein
MSRNEALKIMEHIPYPSERDIQDDVDYFLKKMGWTREMLNNYIKRPPVDHLAYPSYEGIIHTLSSMKNFLKKISIKSK